jgi:PAS domain S-box-containing protein
MDADSQNTRIAEAQGAGMETRGPAGMDPSFFQRLFEATPNPYLILSADPGFTILAVNDSYLEATGTRREAILGQGLFTIFPDNPNDSSGSGVSDLRTSLNRVLGDRKPDTMGVQKYDIPLRDGSMGFRVRYWSPVNVPVLGPGGAVAWIIHHVEDVTEFIQGREKVAELGKVEARAERMEAEVLQRAAEVKSANRALKTALEELERREAELARLNGRLTELDRLKTDFFANISHELRTPLTLILGPLDQRLGEPGLEPGLRSDLERMSRNARILLAQVNDMLDLAKLDAGRMGLRLARTDLAHLVRLEASRFESLAQERGLAFEVEAPGPFPAELDEDKVRRILANLLANALKFTPSGGWVRIRLAAAGADEAAVEVSDSGPGIAEALRDSVFERFRQVEGGSARPKPGTGLGLAIVKEFVLLHGGRVLLDASPAGGARFQVRLPTRAPAGSAIHAAEGGAGPEVPELLAYAEPAPGAPAGRGEDAPRVLVVEDNPDMSEFLASALARVYRVETADNGAEGVKRALAAPPDLVLSDVMMPGMGGDQLVEELRRHPPMDDVPIVLLTAKADEALRVRMLRLGVGDYLYKPFSMDELMARVGALVEERRKGQAARKLQEARFQESLRLDAAMMDNVSDGIYLVGERDGTILRTNRELDALFGYLPGELVGRHASLLNAPGDRTPAEITAGMRRSLERTGAWSGEVESVRKDGTRFWTLVTKSEFHHEEFGKVWVAARQDITARKEAEGEIQRLQADLERRVAERTSELQAANGELESFAYTVSHDLRAPLNAMGGLGRILAEELGPRLEGVEKQYLDRIILASERMNALIEGILQLSRTNRGRLLREWVDLSGLAQRIRDELEEAEPGRPVSWDLAPGLRAWGDPRLLEDLLRNLLGNAWKYSAGRDPASIRLEGEVLADGIRFAVRDNGAGFDMAGAGQLFQPFQRLHRQEQFPGLGIGLATARRIVQRHGGSLEAWSQPDQGARFTCSLPAPPGDAALG